jgi:protein N-terminal amidase
MDLNPQPPTLWTLASGPYEIADHCIATKTQLLVLLNSWLDSEEDTEASQDWSTLNYWAARLRPLWQTSSDSIEDKKTPTDSPRAEENGDETIVVICNRTGEENGARIMTLQPHPYLYHIQARFSLGALLSFIYSEDQETQRYYT